MGSTAETGTILEKLFGSIETVADDKARMELLTNLKLAMGTLSRAQLMEHMNNLNLEVLFGCLVSDNSEQIQSTCDILKNLMTVLDPVACLDKYHESITQGFSHDAPEVPALIMSHLTRCIEVDESSLNKYPNLRVAVIGQLASEELNAAKEADKLLMKYGTTKSGKDYFLSQEAVDTFNALLNKKPSISETKKFRVYEVLTNISTLSADHFNTLNTSVGLMNLLITLSFKSDDFLGQINAIEILANLAGCPHGQEALKTAGVFQEIKTLTESLGTEPHGEILLPGIIKFIGKVGAVSLPPTEMTALVMTTILQSGINFPLKTVAVEAFAHIGGTVEGKQYYKNLPNIRKYFELIRELLSIAPTESRTRGLEAMSFLFGSDEANEDCLPHWFNILFHDMSELMDLVRLPFPEMRIAALNFLSSIAHLEWAQRHYLKGAGVIEFLTSRNPEPVKECVYAKFRLVQIIVDSPSAAKILSAENMALLKLYIHQGPFYAHAEATVATAGAE
ncbi:26S proteasome non-ATPase regulatory subunit 5 [Folsomia candida]|uniref:26S proteasome non-ATPase regulatory subunit 5 n=1 Tax=Folsomia candida TaxID=158441 RepID=UPI000B903AD2|nr:26S proteasome non-ATPase regulatory subunit 5 [Folsomia candida]